MPTAFRVYWIGLQLHKSGLSFAPARGHMNSAPLSVAVRVCNLTYRWDSLVHVPSPNCLTVRQNGGFNTTKGVLVSASTQRRPRHAPRFDTANAAWKAQWDSVLSWSIMLAVALHAAAFAFWPDWEYSDVFFNSDLELLGTAWMALYAPPTTGGGGGSGGIAAPSLAMLEEPDSLPPEGAPEGDAWTGLGSSQQALAALPARLRERLAGRNGPVPTIVRFAAAPDAPGLGDNPTSTVEEEEDDAVTAQDPSTDNLALLLETLETSPLDLSRLSGIRPQIVLPGTSAWILIRNPAEVDQFMSRSLQDSEAQGLVDVAVWIDEWGSVEWAEISRSSGLEEMDEIALALFNEVATFRPARDRGIRVSLSVIFSVPFPW